MGVKMTILIGPSTKPSHNPNHNPNPKAIPKPKPNHIHGCKLWSVVVGSGQSNRDHRTEEEEPQDTAVNGTAHDTAGPLTRHR